MKDPKTIFLEDFENVGTPQGPVSLTNYANVNLGRIYSADPYWLDPKYCNGFITRSSLSLNQNLIFNTYCGQNGDSTGSGQGDYMAVRAKAYALGQHAKQNNPQAKDPQNNHALSTNTSGGKPTSVMFQTTSNEIWLRPDGDVPTRFIAFSVDAADTTGREIASPQMYFYLLQQGKDPVKLNDEPLGVTGGNYFDLSGTFPNFPTWARAGNVGTFYSEPFQISSELQVGLRLDNESPASSQGCGAYATPHNCWAGQAPEHKGIQNGNDGAIDNIGIHDVTPSLDKAFSPTVQSIGRVSQMVLTVNNRTDLGKKHGWGFVDTLPEGLRFANAEVSGTCSADVLKVDPEAQTLTVKNGRLERGESSCTIITNVTSLKEGTYVNGRPNGNFTDQKYIDGPDNAEVEFVSGTLSWKKVGSDKPDTPLGGSQWNLVGPDPATALEPVGGWPVGQVVDCVAKSAEQCEGLDKDPRAGYFKVEHLPTGEYGLEETKAPSGYLSPGQHLQTDLGLDSLNAHFGESGVIVNQLGKAVWNKVDELGKPLAGSEWKLTREAQEGIAAGSYSVSDCVGGSAEDCSGMLDKDHRAGYFEVRDLLTGKYWLEETVAPTGYQPIEEKLGPYEIKTDTPRIDFGSIKNSLTRGSVAWEKTDKVGKHLNGSKWRIARTGGEEIIVEDNAGDAAYNGRDVDPRPGYFKVEDLDHGDYELQELRAPAGYELDQAISGFAITKANPEFVFEIAFINDRREAVSLPLTGGTSRDFYSLLGGGLLVAGLLTAVTVRQQRK